ncbi:MAG: flagellar basal body P-ring formation chaperone FlgA [Cycloclasticus sp.]
MKLFLKALVFLLLSPSLAMASNTRFENHQNIKDQAYSYIESKLNSKETEYSIKIHHIDHRIKLKKCTSAIDINLTQAHVKPGKNTLNIQCSSPVPWRVFMTANVTIFSYALVSKHPLNKGHLIQKSDLALKKIVITGRRTAYLNDTKQAINHVLKRRVNRGDIISVNNLAKQTLIKKGDTISIIAKNNGFQISMKGIALMAGSKGDKIKVKNIKTKKTIQGIVFDTQTVRVNI